MILYKKNYTQIEIEVFSPYKIYKGEYFEKPLLINGTTFELNECEKIPSTNVARREAHTPAICAYAQYYPSEECVLYMYIIWYYARAVI